MVCLQETKLPADRSDFKIRGYQAHHLIHTDGQIACGGVSVLVGNTIPHRKVQLTTRLQAIAVRSTLHRPITICSVYISPNRSLELAELHNLLGQLPTPFIITGDFNAHSPLWGNTDTNQRGLCVEKLLLESDVYLANGTAATHVNQATLHTSSIDLTLCDPILVPELSWSVQADLNGSDHFPVSILMTPPGISPCSSRRSIRRTDWEVFSRACLQSINSDLDSYETFIERLTEVCDAVIPVTSGKPRKHNAWFTPECRVAVDEKKKAYRRAARNPTVQNIVAFRLARARARRTLRENKRRSFHEFVSKINSRTPLNTVWKMIRNLKGSGKISSSCHVRRSDGAFAETERDIANVLAERLSLNSSSAHYTHEFQRVKRRAEHTTLHFTSANTEYYNKTFTLGELRCSLSETKCTAPGPDNITYEIIRRLPEECLAVLLNVFNKIWTTQTFPDGWRSATVVPIPKPGKDHTDATNYRPISLTSCLFKLMEKMVNRRLVWYLEQNDCLSDLQCGFRRIAQQSTTWSDSRASSVRLS